MRPEAASPVSINPSSGRENIRKCFSIGTSF
jgi:hypothetical protein